VITLNPSKRYISLGNPVGYDTSSGENTSWIRVGSEMRVLGSYKRAFRRAARVVSIDEVNNTVVLDRSAEISSINDITWASDNGYNIVTFQFIPLAMWFDDNIIALPLNGQVRIKPSISNNEIEKNIYVLRTSTTGDETKILTTDGNTPGGTHLYPGEYNGIRMPNQSTWNFTAKINAYSDLDDGVAAGFSIRGVAKNDDFDTITILPSIITESWKDSALEFCSTDIGTNGSKLEFMVTGISGENINWSGTLEVCQAQYLDPSSGGGTGGGGV
jgi:hypothetical protein